MRARASAASERALSTTPTSPLPRAAPVAAAEATVRIVPSTGRTTALRARSEAWAIASVRTSGLTSARAGRRHALAHAPQQLGEDDARVPPGSHQRPVPDGLAHLGQAGSRVDALELADHRLEGQGHVRARVAVGHRVDVQAVDVGLMEAERIAIAPHDGTQIVGAQGRRGAHGRGC